MKSKTVKRRRAAASVLPSRIFRLRRYRVHLVVALLIVIVLGSVYAWSMTRAAVPLSVDTTLPQPTNVVAVGDDRAIIVSWNKVVNSRVVGYYISYRPVGSTQEYSVRQTVHEIIQLQPLVNGTEYEINVQSAAGTYLTTDAGPLVHTGNQGNTFARANGKVSNKSTTRGTPNGARVDAMRQRLTGFFDDFNYPSGPFNEKLWNRATTACIKPGTAAAFLNPQFHSHNMVSSSCDRAGMATRPRAVFDITNATEVNPAQIEFDIDGASHKRDTWYIDLIPLSARTNGLPLDITSHNDADDQDHNDPGNMLRINQKSEGLNVHYYNSVRNTNFAPYSGQSDISLRSTNAACSYFGSTLTFATCDMTKKVAGLSPIPQSSAPLVPDWYKPIIPNVRRHWVIQVTPTKLKIFIDSVLIGEGLLPADFVREKKFTLHSTIFSYNTGKDTTAGEVVPYVQMFHWDNFGFTGPAPSETIHNYMEGGTNGTTPIFSTSNGIGGEIPEGPRTTIIKVPDPIGNLVNSQGRLYMTLANFSQSTYTWSPNDHILFNGTRYNIPDPATLVKFPITPSGCTQFVGSIWPFALAIPIAKADIRQGDNTVRFNISGAPNSCASRPPGQLNVHLELPYSRTDTSLPAYSPPQTVFGSTLNHIIQPPMTNCDQYRYVEQDLGLPYEAAKPNLHVGPCEMMASHNTGTTPPAPPPVPPLKPGDADGNGVVNGLDLSKILSNYSKSVSTRTEGDLNGDGIVNGIDLSQVLTNYGI